MCIFTHMINVGKIMIKVLFWLNMMGNHKSPQELPVVEDNVTTHLD